MKMTKKHFIQKMRTLVLDIHRYASALDTVIDDIEKYTSDCGDTSDKMLIATLKAHYQDTIKQRFGDLKKREEELWSLFI